MIIILIMMNIILMIIIILMIMIIMRKKMKMIQIEKKIFFASSQIDSDDDEVFVMKSLNDCIDIEIIVWLLQRFQYSDMTLELLIKSWQNILLYFDKLQFKDFLMSLYVVYIILQLK